MSDNLLQKIEKLRNELNEALDQDVFNLNKDKILKLSIELDQLILEYIKQA